MNGEIEQSMSPCHKSILRESSPVLIENMQADSWFISLLKQKKILTEFDYQRVLSKPTLLDTSRAIIHILKTKSDNCFFKFAETLCETKQCHLSKKLRECSKYHGNSIINTVKHLQKDTHLSRARL